MKTWRPATRNFLVWNRSRGTAIAEQARLAHTPRDRRMGLLGQAALPPGGGLWIVPTQAIHTFWMRFPIDVVFLDRQLRVQRLYHHLAPFRLTRLVLGARSVLELPSGVLRRSGTTVGDELQFSLREI